MVTRDVERDLSRCPNCSAELAQEYCPSCGQRRIRPEDLSARRFFHEWFDEFANLQMKFKTVRTLRGLLIPGWLTAEYLAGRRQPYPRHSRCIWFARRYFSCRRPWRDSGLSH
jgi:hypothetical protein